MSGAGPASCGERRAGERAEWGEGEGDWGRDDRDGRDRELWNKSKEVRQGKARASAGRKAGVSEVKR